MSERPATFDDTIDDRFDDPGVVEPGSNPTESETSLVRSSALVAVGTVPAPAPMTHAPSGARNSQTSRTTIMTKYYLPDRHSQLDGSARSTTASTTSSHSSSLIVHVE